MNSMTIHGIRRVGQNRLEYSYDIAGDWSGFFQPDEPMWAEYSVPVAHIPDSIAVLPLVGNVIVLASLMDANIYVDEIDKDFYNCIEDFLRGFDTIMPEHVHFKRKDIVHPKRIVETPPAAEAKKENLLFFSGGVDATCSLVQHLEEKPALVTVWGADIPWDHEERWNRAIGFNKDVADRNGLKVLTIRSNFRRSLNNDHIDDYSMALVKDWWWSAFHHSVAMMCLAAPLAAGTRSKLYFGSSYSAKDKKEWGSYVLASDPLIDNFVRFCGCQVVHDGYEFSRYDKIKRICEHYSGKKETCTLRVCYLSDSGKNCGTCEKCASTIMSILVAGYSPEDFGFEYDEAALPYHYAAGLQQMAREGKYDFLSLYYDVQTAFREKYSAQEVHPVLRTFYDADLEKLADFLYVPVNELTAKEKAVAQMQKDFWKKYALLQEQQNEQLQEIYNSTSWKITKPVRLLREMIHSLRRSGTDQ